jgi:hypothetical protein
VPGAVDDYHLIQESVEWHVEINTNSFHFLCLSLEHFTATLFFVFESNYFTIGTFARENKKKQSSINLTKSRKPNQLYLNYMGVELLAANRCYFSNRQ